MITYISSFFRPNVRRSDRLGANGLVFFDIRRAETKKPSTKQMLSRAILSRYHLNSTCPQDRSSFMPITRQAVHRYFRPISAVSRRQLGALPLCILPYGILTAVRSLKRQSDKPLRLQRFYNTIVPPRTAFGKRISAKRLSQNYCTTRPITATRRTDITQTNIGQTAVGRIDFAVKHRISKRQVGFRERFFGILYTFFQIIEQIAIKFIL